MLYATFYPIAKYRESRIWVALQNSDDDDYGMSKMKWEPK